MRIFKKFNNSNKEVCPICKTGEEKETVLIGINGTQKDGIIEAKQFHFECLEFVYYPETSIIAMKL